MTPSVHCGLQNHIPNSANILWHQVYIVGFVAYHIRSLTESTSHNTQCNCGLPNHISCNATLNDTNCTLWVTKSHFLQCQQSIYNTQCTLWVTKSHFLQCQQSIYNTQYHIVGHQITFLTVPTFHDTQCTLWVTKSPLWQW